MTDIQGSFFFFLPPPEEGGARVPCQISDLAGWEREGEFLAKRFSGGHRGATPPYSHDRFCMVLYFVGYKLYRTRPSFGKII